MRLALLSLLFCATLASATTPSAPALAYSTYLRDGFTPTAIAADSSGNIYLTGNIVIDPAANQTTVLVVKLNPQGTQYLYQRYLGGSVSDRASSIAVDSAGNAFIAGQTISPDFPVTAGGSLGTAPAGQTDPRSFVTKFDPNGNLVFSDLLGGSAASSAQAVAVTSGGQVVVSGISQASGFPTTTGAYSVANSTNHPYLLKLDSTGTKLMFAATGIGGKALAIDSSGNIYVAGDTGLLSHIVGLNSGATDYPTTPGAYQSSFPSAYTCLFPCQIVYEITGQYVTKVDPTGAKLIYSTSLSGPGNTFNGGLAVDQAGNAYVTGYAQQGYPYTVTPPTIPMLPGLGDLNFAVLPFLSKLDPAGQTLLFSVPLGGVGVQLDSTGAVYVGGRIGFSAGSASSLAITASLPALAGVPASCLPNTLTIQNSGYVSQADATTGGLLGTQFISGSNVFPSGIALIGSPIGSPSGSKIWIAAGTAGPDVAFTPDALATDFGGPYYGANLGAGAYLGAVDFSQPQPGSLQAGSPQAAPQIGCLLDGADFSPVGPATRYQIVALFGSGLGPAVGVNAPDNSTTSLGGVSITVGGLPAILLYVSSTQINFVVPLVEYQQYSATLQVTVNGASSPMRGLRLDYGNPHLFMNTAATFGDPNNQGVNSIPNFIPLALNPDGSINSSTNPAPPGATVSVFLNGAAPDPDVTTGPLEISASNDWTVLRTTLISPFVWRVDAQAPMLSLSAPLPCVNCGCTQAECNASLVLSLYGQSISPASGATLWFKQ